MTRQTRVASCVAVVALLAGAGFAAAQGPAGALNAPAQAKVAPPSAQATVKAGSGGGQTAPPAKAP